MAKKGLGSEERRSDEGAGRRRGKHDDAPASAAPTGGPSAVTDTRVIYCGDNLEQLAKQSHRSADLSYMKSQVNPRPRFVGVGLNHLCFNLSLNIPGFNMQPSQLRLVVEGTG